MHRAQRGPFRVRIQARQRAIFQSRHWSEGSPGNVVFPNEGTKLNQNGFRFVPISMVPWRRAQSRVEMNVFQTPLTELAATSDRCAVQSRTAATSALTFMTFS